MNACRLPLSILFVLVFFTLPAEAVIERVLDKTFSVTSDSATVRVDTFSGGIKVTTSDSPQIRVLIRQTVSTDDAAAAEEAIARLEVTLEQNADGCVLLNIDPRHRVRWTWQNWSPVTLAIEITVPRACGLQLRTGEGPIQVDSLRGNVVAETERGTIFLGEIDGDVTATNERGDVAVTACTGKLRLKTKSGNLLVGRSGGPAQLHAVDGVIDVQAAKGPIAARGDRSDIKVSFLPSVRAPSELKSSGGDITVGFDPASAFSIDAQSSTFGLVRVRDLELKTIPGSDEASRVTGMLNGGGPLLKIRAAGGNVRLNRVPSS
jgi:hypothetical protein